MRFNSSPEPNIAGFLNLLTQFAGRNIKSRELALMTAEEVGRAPELKVRQKNAFANGAFFS